MKGLLASIVHGADIGGDEDGTHRSCGLLAIADGLYLLGQDDLEQLRLELPVYDALYAWCQRETAAA